MDVTPHEWPEEDVLICRGKEFAGRGQIDRTWSALHVPGLFITDAPPAPAAMSMQDFVDWVADPLHSYVADGYGGLTVVAHAFHCATAEFTGCRLAHLNRALIEPLDGLTGLELAHHGACGFADRLWDELLCCRLARGAPLLWGFGADDTHFGHSHKLGLSWTATKLRRFHTWELKRSMREGAVYATNGLRDLDIRVRGDEIAVRSREPVDVRWLTAGQHYDDFGLEGFTRHGFKLAEPVPLERARTLLGPIVDAAPGPNHCLQADRGVTESRFRPAAAHGPVRGFVRCVLLRPADLAAFAAALEAGTAFAPGVPPHKRPQIVKAFFMPMRRAAPGGWLNPYPDEGQWVTGSTHNHGDLRPHELDRAAEYFAAYRAAGHLAAFETGYTITPNPCVRYPPGGAPHVADVWSAAGRTDRGTDLWIDGAGFAANAVVRVGGRSAAGVERVSSERLRATVPAGLPAGVYDVTVRNPATPYQHTLSEGLVVRTPDARTDGWRHFGLRDGLPDAHVYCILAAYGRLWAGTNRGAAWREGDRWVADRSGPVVVESLSGDAAGNLWACGHDGVFRRDAAGAWRRFTTADGLRADSGLNSVFCAADGSVYLTGNSPAFIARFDGTRWSEEHSERGVGRWLASNLLAGPNGEIWAGSVLHTGLRRTPGGWLPIEAPSLAAWLPRRLYRTPAGRLAAATMAREPTPTGGVCILEDGQWRVFNQRQGLPHHRVWDLAIEPDDTIWAATSFGLGRVAPDRTVTGYTCLDSGLPSNRVNAVAVCDGTLWVGTERGLACLDLAQLL